MVCGRSPGESQVFALSNWKDGVEINLVWTADTVFGEKNGNLMLAMVSLRCLLNIPIEMCSRPLDLGVWSSRERSELDK